MHRFYSVFCCLLGLLFSSCGDGDEFTVDIDFDQELEVCIVNGSFVIFDTRESPFESLTLVIPINEVNERILFNPIDSDVDGSFSLSTDNQLNFRSYNGDPLEIICQPIPSSSVIITDDIQASSGIINYSSTSIEENSIRTITIDFSISNLDIEILRATEFTLGTLIIEVEL